MIAAAVAAVLFNIPAGSLVDQMKFYADQAHASVLYKYTTVPQYADRPALQGQMSKDEALEQLLAGTPLTFSWSDPLTVTLRAPEDTARIIDGVRYDCVATKWVSGMIFTRLGYFLWQMGEVQSDLYCTPAAAPPSVPTLTDDPSTTAAPPPSQDYPASATPSALQL